MNLGDFREDYRRGALDRTGLNANPLAQFEAWFAEAAGSRAGAARADIWRARAGTAVGGGTEREREKRERERVVVARV